MALSAPFRSTNYSSGVQKRSGTGALYNKSKAAGLLVDTADSSLLKYSQAGTARTLVSLDGTQTLTGKSLTSPTITGTVAGGATYTSPTLTSPTITGAIGDATKFCTTQFDAVTGTTGTTLTNVVGLTGFSLVAGATYKFEVNLAGVSTANSGYKVGFGYTTLTATSIESTGKGFTASAVAVQHTTTATTGMTLFGQTAAVINVLITGQLVVNAAGTLAVQAAQNAAHADTTSVYVGSWATFTRTA